MLYKKIPFFFLEWDFFIEYTLGLSPVLHWLGFGKHNYQGITNIVRNPYALINPEAS
ncbi:MAG: hypothetical protein ACKVOM_02770 [Ferruginibacter sp.]